MDLQTRKIEFSKLKIEELYLRINKSEQDFKNGKYKTSKELLSKYLNPEQ